MQTKIFIGFPLTLSLRTELRYLEVETLIRIPHHGKEYIGFYIEKHQLSLPELKTLASHITTTLQSKLERHLLDSQSIVLFPETFLG